jgi:hypothetical protein
VGVRSDILSCYVGIVTVMRTENNKMQPTQVYGVYFRPMTKWCFRLSSNLSLTSIPQGLANSRNYMFTMKWQLSCYFVYMSKYSSGRDRIGFLESSRLRKLAIGDSRSLRDRSRHAAPLHLQFLVLLGPEATEGVSGRIAMRDIDPDAEPGIQAVHL